MSTMAPEAGEAGDVFSHTRLVDLVFTHFTSPIYFAQLVTFGALTGSHFEA